MRVPAVRNGKGFRYTHRGRARRDVARPSLLVAGEITEFCGQLERVGSLRVVWQETLVGEFA
jgi:hypothetical protein